MSKRKYEDNNEDNKYMYCIIQNTANPYISTPSSNPIEIINASEPVVERYVKIKYPDETKSDGSYIYSKYVKIPYYDINRTDLLTVKKKKEKLLEQQKIKNEIKNLEDKLNHIKHEAKAKQLI